MKKRFLSLLLVLVLIMSLMPAALAVNADDAQPKTISVTFRLHTDTDEWIAPTEVSDLPEGTSVFTVFQKVLADKGYTYEYHEQYCYVQAITAPDGTRLAEFSKGQNSGWLFRVNNDFADVGMNDFMLMDGDEIEVRCSTPPITRRSLACRCRIPTCRGITGRTPPSSACIPAASWSA